MIMVADPLPGLKGVLQRSGLRGTAAAMATRLIARSSCILAACRACKRQRPCAATAVTEPR